MNISPSARVPTSRLLVAVMLLQAATVATIATGCQPTVDTGPPPPAPTTLDTSLCDEACAGFRRANCPEGFDTPAGGRCEDVCVQSSLKRAWPLRCWANASNRDAVLACGPATRCRQRP